MSYSSNAATHCHEADVFAAQLMAGDPSADASSDALAALLVDVAGLVRTWQSVQALLVAKFAEATSANARQTAAWLRNQHGVAMGAARELAKAALVMNASPAMADAVACGAASVEHAAKLSSIVNEIVSGHAPAVVLDGLVPNAGESAELFAKRAEQALLAALPDGGAARSARQRRNSTCTSFTADDGRVGLHALLDPERGAIVTNALDRIVDAQWRNAGNHTTKTTPVDLAHARADALVELAERAFSGGATAAVPLLVVHVQAGALYDDLAAHGVECTLEDGTPIPAATARRLACEANILPIVLGGGSQPLDVGRTRRLATETQRHAMRARSATCEFDNCDKPTTYCKAHHVHFWEHGGPTNIDNLAWACTYHHTRLHQSARVVARTPASAHAPAQARAA